MHFQYMKGSVREVMLEGQQFHSKLYIILEEDSHIYDRLQEN